MTSLALHRARDPMAALRRAEPLYTACGLWLAALMAPTALAATIDGRALAGISVWDKPFKFQLALAIYAFTLAFFARWVPEARKATRSYRWFVRAVVFAIAAEVVWITGAAAFGVKSHFNLGPVMGVVYVTMGGLATLLTAATAHQALLIHRNPASGLTPLVKAGIVWGLALTLPLTLATAGVMSSGQLPGAVGHHVGGTLGDAEGLFFFHWSRDSGDLRVSHFLATHTMHAVPLAAWTGKLAGLAARRWAWLAAGGWSAFVVATFMQAAMGLPLVPA